MVSADFDAYFEAQRGIDARWQVVPAWTRASILNVARMPWFSSDRTIREYAQDIWNVPGRGTLPRALQGVGAQRGGTPSFPASGNPLPLASLNSPAQRGYCAGKLMTSLRANGSRERAPGDTLREAIQEWLTRLDCFVASATRNDGRYTHCVPRILMLTKTQHLFDDATRVTAGGSRWRRQT